MLKHQRFGVEIEMTGITRAAAARAISRVLGDLGYSNEGGPYFAWSVVDQKGRKWMLVRDSSILVEDDTNPFDSQQVELVTPVLEYEDLDLLRTVVNALRQAGAVVNESCGIHVHVDASHHTAKSLRNLVILFWTKQDLIYRALQVNNRRLNFCRPLGRDLFERFVRVRGADMERLADAWYIEDYDRHARYHETRYHGLNLHSVWYRGTIEFRFFNGTLDADKITAYVQFCLAMSAKAIAANNGFYHERVDATAPDAPKRWQTWLYNLGLRGDEFKNARRHLSVGMKQPPAVVWAA